MISVKRLCDSTANQYFSVESRLPDGKLQCITRSLKFKCNARGFDDADARAKALRFAITTDTLVQFRAFIFSEQDATTAGALGRLEGSVSSGSSRVDAFLSLGSSPEGGKRRGIRSYVCLRQNRLTGLRFVVAMSRLENGRLRAVSFQDQSLVGAGTPEEALNKAVRFLRGVAFDSWRKQNTNDLMSRNHRETFGHRRERALKHVSAFVEIETGEKVDCACGKNRSRGLMVACERCGAWEHAECQGFRSNKQIPADYICSACMRAEREDVVVIRLDEQGECANLQLEDLWTDVKPREREVDDSVCCICGCEDNQDFEAMIHPTTEHVCGDGATIAHPACISAAQNASNKNWTKHIARLGLCQICGERLLKSPKEELHTSSGVSSVKNSSGSISPNTSQARSSRRAAKTDQGSRKRLRSALTNGGVAAKVEVPEREKRTVKSVEEESDGHPSRSGDKADSAGIEVSKVASTLLGRRFSDATVTVPIKKRKFQMLEVARSPSPPPRSPSPSPMMETVTTEREASAVTGLNSKSNVGHCSEDAEMVEGGSVEIEAVTSPVVHNSTVGDIKDSGPAICEKNSSCSEADRIDPVTRRPSNISDTPTLSRSRQKEDHAACKERLKFGENSRPSENGRVQHDPLASPLGQQSSSLENAHPEELLGARGGVMIVTEAEEMSREPLVEASKGVNQEGTASATHEPVRVKLSEKVHTSAADIEMGEFDERHVGTSRSSDLAASGPIQEASVRDPDCCSDPLRCEKDVSLDTERKEGQSSDVDVKDIGRSSSASQGPSRDARLHWDLNMDMEEWERPPEEDTGTFPGVGLALAAPVASSTDTDHGVDQRVGTSDPESEAPPTPADSARVVDSIVNEEKGILPVEGSHTDGECDISSSEAGDAGTKPLEVSGAMESAVSTAPAHVHAANVQEQQDMVVAVEHRLTSSKPHVGVEEGVAKKVEKLSAACTPDQPLPADREESGNDERGRHSLPKVTVEESIKQYPGAEVNAGEELKSGADMLVDKIPPPEVQCSASTSAVEVGGKLSSDADFLGKFEASKVKGSSDESLQAPEGSKALDGTANYDSSVLSADNYDFVEYDASDEEDDEPEERLSVGKPVPANKVEGLPSAELAQPGCPREWNEAQAEEMEAEHVDYDDSGDSRAGEEFGSEADERADGEWRGSAAAREPHEEDRVETGERNPVPTPDHFDANVKGEVGSVSVGEKNLRADALNEPSTVAELAKDADMKDTAEDLRDERREPEIVMAKDRHGEGKINKHSPELKSVEKVDNPHGKEEKRSHEDRDPSSSAARRGDGQNRAKSGWDQLPEGFDNPDDALRAAKGNPVVRTGRGSPWGGSNGRGSSISPRGAPVSSRFGRGLRSDGISDRARSDDSWTREDHQHGIRGDDTLDVSPRLASPRDLGRGRTHGRGGSPVVRARGRMEPWMDSPSGPTSPWGPNRHPSPPGRYNDAVGFGPRGPANAAAVAAAKVESSGFVVAPDGTVTKAGSSSRGPPRPFQTGGRNGRGVMFNMGRGGPGMGMGVGMNLGGLRVNMGMGRGMSMGPGMAMNMGIGMGIGMGVGPGLGLGLPGRGGPGGRGMDVRYGGPYAGRGSGGSPLVEPSSSSRRGRSHEEYPDGWSRREERSVSPRKRRSLSRRSRSRSHSRSRSRTRSPRARSPRPTNSSGSGGAAGDKNLKKRSHSPVAHKPELKGERAESPPARRSVPPPPKLPLPPPPPRSQRSPPAGLKRLSDSKREGDRARSRDRERERERERPATRARTPPRRTSPHVVHGSALMDDRDRQLLAGIRHVSPPAGRHRPTENSGAVAAAAGANRDSPPDASPPAMTGRVGDGNSEGRRQSGDEGGESRAHVPKREEAGSKLEQRSSKDNSRGERDRSGRRDGGRDRDEERRDVSKISYSSRDRDGRGSSSMRYNREGDDDVAPRRRRPSP